MCVVSMIMEYYTDKWTPRTLLQGTTPMPYFYQVVPSTPGITEEEIAEFRRLLERAREYDARNNEPDCELDSKKKILRDLAKKLGIEIDFL